MATHGGVGSSGSILQLGGAGSSGGRAACSMARCTRATGIAMVDREEAPAEEMLRRGDDEIVSLVARTTDIYRPRQGRQLDDRSRWCHQTSRESDRGRLSISLFDSVEVLHPSQCTKASNQLVHKRNIFYLRWRSFSYCVNLLKTRCSIPELTHHRYYYTPLKQHLCPNAKLDLQLLHVPSHRRPVFVRIGSTKLSPLPQRF